ncbi:MAG TPA: DMT family transporter [Candidatus Limnocylindria bacterium]|nr:DMT family transporter [Candidatus Limnocylindria bacterium]
MNRDKGLGSVMLLLSAVIWGAAFVAQRVGMEHVGPFTFQAVRSLLGSLALLPVIALRGRVNRLRGVLPVRERAHGLLRGGILCGVALFFAINLQQFGLRDTSAGKAGFLTALYILIVPLYGLLLGHRVRRAVWLAVGIAAGGLYLLSVKESFYISGGDLLLVLCAFMFAVQIMLVDHFSVRADGVQLCAAQFLVCGVLSSVCMFVFEKPDVRGLMGAAGPLLYAGVLSSGIAYTLQILAQRTTPPALASLLMSMESVFALAAGMLVLGERPTLREAAGSALVLAAIIIASRASGPRVVEDAPQTA